MQVELDAGETDWTRPGVFEVDPGVYRIPLPLPHDGLKAVNVYALTDDTGLVLIDSGWAIAEARAALEKALGALGHDIAEVRRFLVTHVHRDHYAMAVALRREYGGHVALGAGEQATIEALAVRDRVPLRRNSRELSRAGAVELLEWLQSRADHLHHDPAEWAAPDEWLADGTDLPLPSRTLRVVATPGHTRGHVVFIDAPAGIMFAGDHVLPHITPSIGFEAVPAKLPLGAYLDSLRLVRSMPDRRLLPAHGLVGPSVHNRVDELLEHHAHRLDAMANAVGGGATAYEAAKRVPWTRRERRFAELDPFNQMLAVSETAAHLDLLVAQGRLAEETVEAVCHYRQV